LKIRKFAPDVKVISGRTRMREYSKAQLARKDLHLIRQQDKIVSLYITDGCNCKTIAKKLNVCTTSISRLLKRNGIELRSMSESRRKYNINENIFNSIDSKDKAYWLGLLYADGYHNPNKHEIGISLQEGDAVLVEGLKKFMSYTGPTKTIEFRKHPTWKTQRKLIVTNKKMSKDLLHHGLIHEKTLKMTFPRWLKEDLLSSFILGYFDGDGTLSYNEARGQLRWQIVGTVDFIEYIRNYFYLNLGTGMIKYSDVRTKNKKVVVLRYFGNKQVRRICDWMYADARIFLKRKKDKLMLIRP
jgi:predicted DNA-binding protein YlxM (UPF0122 family)